MSVFTAVLDRRVVAMDLHHAARYARTAAIVVLAGLAGFLAFNADLPGRYVSFAVARDGVMAAAMLAISIRLVGSRKEGMAGVAAWYLGAQASLPLVWTQFFGNAWGWAAYPALAVLLALPALLAPRRRPALGMVVAIVLAAVPPLGLLGMGNPLLMAGALFPGLGWWGLGLTVVCLALSAWRGKPAVLLQLVALGWAVMALSVHPGSTLTYAWADTTYFGEPKPDLNAMYDHIDTVQRGVTAALDEGAKLIVLPEGTDRDWGAGEVFYWKQVTALAKRKGATVLLGVYTDPLAGPRSDGLVDLTTGALYPAAVTVPFGMWAPWRVGDFPLHLDASRTIPTPYGPAAHLICYEELLPWPLALQMLEGHPALLVSAANQWFGHGWLLRPQQRGAALQARLWGLPLLRAVNYARVR